MIVVSDTTPLISLLKINRIDLLEKLFGDVLIPQAVFDELTVRIMGTIGILMAAYEEHELTSDEVRECVDGLQRAGRHIGQRHYQMLLSRLKD